MGTANNTHACDDICTHSFCMLQKYASMHLFQTNWIKKPFLGSLTLGVPLRHMLQSCVAVKTFGKPLSIFRRLFFCIMLLKKKTTSSYIGEHTSRIHTTSVLCCFSACEHNYLKPGVPLNALNPLPLHAKPSCWLSLHETANEILHFVHRQDEISTVVWERKVQCTPQISWYGDQSATVFGWYLTLLFWKQAGNDQLYIKNFACAGRHNIVAPWL